MNLFGQPKIVTLYKHLRKVSLGLPKKILEATRPLDFDMAKAAKKLTLPFSAGAVVFESETETAALTDFYMHEFFKGGRRVIDCCDPVVAGFSPDECDLLEAHRQSRTSLFEIAEVEPKSARLRLRDILEPDRPDVMLSDVAMSQTRNLTGKVLLFLRVVTCQSIEMTSGNFFTFSPQHRERLLSEHARRMQTVSAGEHAQRRFIFFFQRYREFGEPQGFAG